TLKWKNVPAQTSSFALLMNDVDAAVAGGFHHWIVYNIPATARMLQGNAPYTQGTNSLNIRTYFGPCPPATGEKHHYIFTLYALSTQHLQQSGLTYNGLFRPSMDTLWARRRSLARSAASRQERLRTEDRERSQARWPWRVGRVFVA